jgi:hypothetical protein
MNVVLVMVVPDSNCVNVELYVEMLPRIKLLVADEGYRKKFKKVHNNDVFPPLSEHHVRARLIRRIFRTQE